ncbi:3-hydroxyacyl-CoA dehydrogenase [Subtercola boreus]|uniref:3-hydroxyacyl-CoA dehydrogenase n=1 Tax=Subtercola boreus TaxID=120213 RepID=A0A3E0VMD0_9MICO|nr:SDR family NAD(P)-dependent oxidoreductase [Subtercola boreus]RFA10835.1 3-hydroxyacyl-CoA dehydrogenase [Subtercola boreus]TQL55583.1 NAD(P)-dependent dehydrogenase (short-subunit alcohol dehydrogenase family) [Subtercola boreus]
MELTGAHALVTGAASGLGAATALALAARGATVTGLDLPGALETATLPGAVRFVAADITDEDQVQQAIDSIDGPLRVVVNCAGIGPARRILSKKGVHELALFQKTIDINLVGTFNVMRLAAEKMAGDEPYDEFGARGVVVNTASVAAYEGQIGQIAYAASKGGVVAMTIAAARDLASSGIRVVTIAPGIVDTPMLAALGPEVNESLAKTVTFPARLARPGEFAALVLTIADSDYLNGETIRLDGAIRMTPR